MPCGRQDPSSWPGIQPVPPATSTQSLNHWPTRETPGHHFYALHTRGSSRWYVRKYGYLSNMLVLLCTIIYRKIQIEDMSAGKAIYRDTIKPPPNQWQHSHESRCYIQTCFKKKAKLIFFKARINHEAQ